MRFTYGNVLPYDPADAVHYNFYTTLEGVMQKEVITEDKNTILCLTKICSDLYNAKDFGPWQEKKMELPVGLTMILQVEILGNQLCKCSAEN